MSGQPGRGSRVVFVGNIPYDMSEEQLISIFSEVGPVAGFRLVFDRDTGKPKGYGFCEFHDPETAASAVRNLNDVDVGGRSLRIDWADVDPVFQGRTTQMGVIEGDLPKRDGRRPGNPGQPAMGRGMGPQPGSGSYGLNAPQLPQMDGVQSGGYNLNQLPQGINLAPGQSATDAITQTLATLPPNQLLDIMGQIKSLILTSPQSAHSLLTSHPQLTYALFQSMLMMNLVDPAILQRILAGSGAMGGNASSTSNGPSGPPPPLGQPGRPPTNVNNAYGTSAAASQQAYPGAQPPYQQRPPVYGNQNQRPPPANAPYPPPAGVGLPPHLAGGASNTPPHYMTPPPPGAPPAQPPQAAAPPGGGNGNLGDSQRQLLQQVLSLTDAQIAALPPDQRESIMMLRKQYNQ